MKQFEGFKSEARAERYPMLPAGAYVCGIKNVKIEGQEPDQQLVLRLEIVEGESDLSEVNIPARSPGLSSTGPLVSLNPTPNSLAMMFDRVVLPSPGGPCSNVWSRGSPLYFAASTNTSRFSTTFCCPLKSLNESGRKAFSKSFSAPDVLLFLISKSSIVFLISSAKITILFLIPNESRYFDRVAVYFQSN